MKIISKFHDYYDSVMAHGQDSSILYQRKTLVYTNLRLIQDGQISLKDAPNSIKTLHTHFNPTRHDWDFLSRLYRSRGILYSEKHSYDLTRFAIVFCGKTCRGVSVVKQNKGTLDCISREVFYFNDALSQYLESEGLKGFEKDIAKIFDGKNVDYDWLIENKVICAAIDSNSVIINPRLDFYQFYRLFDSYSAAQELSMWIGGTLSYPQNEMIELDDKYRVMAHGFDKFSFRKAPTKVR